MKVQDLIEVTADAKLAINNEPHLVQLYVASLLFSHAVEALGKNEQLPAVAYQALERLTIELAGLGRAIEALLCDDADMDSVETRH
jgi:hypothetical protein